MRRGHLHRPQHPPRPWKPQQRLMQRAVEPGIRCVPCNFTCCFAILSTALQRHFGIHVTRNGFGLVTDVELLLPANPLYHTLAHAQEMSEAPKSTGQTKRGHPRQQTLHDMRQKRPRLENTIVGDAGSSGVRRTEEAGPSSSAPTTSTPRAASAGKVCSVCTKSVGRTKYKCKGYKRAEHPVHLGCVENRDLNLCEHCAEKKAEDDAKGQGKV
jgi:hypothetical protein